MKEPYQHQDNFPLYDPRNEHDACGVGFIVNIKGEKSHDIVRKAIQTPARQIAINAGADGSVVVGKLEDIPVGTPYPFSFTITKVNGWERTATTYGGYVLRSSEDPSDILVLSSRCTHLACQVTWREEKQAYVCPCHDASFNKTGGVIDGPPPRPLDRFAAFDVDGDGNLVIVVGEG